MHDSLLHGVVLPDVAAEKQAKAHLEAVEGFNAANLKHTDTQEKIVLPAKEGALFFACWRLFFLHVLFVLYIKCVLGFIYCDEWNGDRLLFCMRENQYLYSIYSFISHTKYEYIYIVNPFLIGCNNMRSVSVHLYWSVRSRVSSTYWLFSSCNALVDNFVDRYWNWTNASEHIPGRNRIWQVVNASRRNPGKNCPSS